MASIIYNAAPYQLMRAGINLASDTMKVALVTSSYTPNQDSHDFFNDVTNEVSGTGYTAGGATLASPTVTQDNTNNLAYFDATDSAWTITTSIVPRGAVIYKDTGSAATSPLLCYIDFGSDYTISNGTLTLQWAATGIFRITS